MFEELSQNYSEAARQLKLRCWLDGRMANIGAGVWIQSDDEPEAEGKTG